MCIVTYFSYLPYFSHTDGCAGKTCDRHNCSIQLKKLQVMNLWTGKAGERRALRRCQTHTKHIKNHRREKASTFPFLIQKCSRMEQIRDQDHEWMCIQNTSSTIHQIFHFHIITNFSIYHRNTFMNSTSFFTAKLFGNSAIHTCPPGSSIKHMR